MKPIRVVYGSDLSLNRPYALLSLIPTQGPLRTTVYSDMWNSSHTSTFQGLWWLLVWHWEQA